MRRDSIFYKLFQTYPALLFELLTNPPENASEYRFDSVAIKEPRFEQLNQGIIELITTIIAYKFETLTRKEVEQMLGITFEETQFYQDIEQTGREKGRKKGREEGEKSLILRLLNRKLGELSPAIHQSIENLSLEQLENLGEALLDFSSMTDLENWLEENNREN